MQKSGGGARVDRWGKIARTSNRTLTHWTPPAKVASLRVTGTLNAVSQKGTSTATFNQPQAASALYTTLPTSCNTIRRASFGVLILHARQSLQEMTVTRG